MHRFLNPLLMVAAIFLGASPQVGHAQIIAAFGDSITAGTYNGGDYGFSWTTALESDLPPSYSILNDSIIGATLQITPVEGPSYQESANVTNIATKAAVANIVIIMLGTNDSKTDNQAGTNANFVSDYKLLINNIVKESTKDPSIYLVTPPPAFTNTYGIDPTYVDGTMKSLVESLKGYDGAQIIDANDALMSTYSNGSGGYLTSELHDGIHPTDLGDEALASVIDAAIDVPEPSTWALVAFAVGALTVIRRRRVL